MARLFWYGYLYNEAVRILKKNNENFDPNDKANSEAIEMMIEDLNDKYSEEV